MGQMRRTVSSRDVTMGSQKPATSGTACPGSAGEAEPPAEGALHCSGGRPRAAAPRGQPRRPSVLLTSSDSEWGAGDGFDDLKAALEDGLGFTLVLAFRSSMPKYRFSCRLRKLWKKHRQQWLDKVEAVALLVADNMLTPQLHSQIATFLKSCQLGCPYAVCHSESVANEFFEACSGNDREDLVCAAPAAPCFLSVASVVDRPSSQPEWSDVQECGCLALLRPLACCGFPAEVCLPVSVLKPLANGALRVIQSPAAEVFVRVSGEEPSLQGRPVRLADDGAKSLADAFSPAGRDGCTAALSLECSSRQLQGCVGASFHIGELVVDAEALAAEKAAARRAVQEASGCHSYDLLHPDEHKTRRCMEGLCTLAYEVLAALLGAAAGLGEEPEKRRDRGPLLE
mmetsp:Transcript_81038/g.229450  ORF Transcript_81038/g.229450 Transcript_81038/m.229450 type:complete len:399 (+) Transcript_81038:50-1246(+)